MDDYERYKRQESIIPTQDINAQTIGVLGVGGVGTWVALYLTQMGVKKIYLIDDDIVDLSNLNRQFFREKDIGGPKVKAMTEIIKGINSDIEVFAFPFRIEELNQIPEDIDIMMCGVDNFEARFMLQDWANQNKDKLVIDMGTNEGATSGTVAMYKYGKTPTYKTLLGTEGMEFAKEEMRTPPCSRNSDPAIVTTTSIVAGLGVDLVRNYLTKGELHSGIFMVSLGVRPCVDFCEETPKGWSG